MKGFFEFMSLAFPWISLGFLFVVFFVRGVNRKKDKHEDYGSVGMKQNELFCRKTIYMKESCILF